MHIATKNKDPDLAKLLVQWGAPPDEQNVRVLIYYQSFNLKLETNGSDITWDLPYQLNNFRLSVCSNPESL